MDQARAGRFAHRQHLWQVHFSRREHPLHSPRIRHGFPIVDRIGHSYFPTVGYEGGMRLVQMILDALLDRKDRTCPEESFELVM
jgi:nitrogenase molybdenum-iron protein alpha/beta subunit